MKKTLALLLAVNLKNTHDPYKTLSIPDKMQLHYEQAILRLLLAYNLFQVGSQLIP